METVPKEWIRSCTISSVADSQPVPPWAEHVISYIFIENNHLMSFVGHSFLYSTKGHVCSMFGICFS